MVVGSVTVPDGRKLWLHGMITGDLFVAEGGAAFVHGTVCGNANASGPAAIYGVVSGDASGSGVSVGPRGQGRRLTSARGLNGARDARFRRRALTAPRCTTMLCTRSKLPIKLPVSATKSGGLNATRCAWHCF